MKIVYSIICGCLFAAMTFTGAYSQRYARLLPGEKVPDIFFPTVLNGDLTSVHLSDFRNKVLILDYWSTWCSSCIEAFPKMSKLQKQFGNELMILPVSFINKKSAVQGFLEKRKDTPDKITFPLAVFENTKNTLFQVLPTVGYPHYIWIDKNGVFLRTSSAEDVNESNIRKAIKGQKLEFARHDYQMDYKRNAPLLIGGNGAPDSTFTYRSLITPFIDSISLSIEVQMSPTRSRILVTNYAPVEIIKYCLYKGSTPDTFGKYVVTEVSDANQFVYHNQSGLTRRRWLQKYACCYDLILPAGYKKEALMRYMQQDIERYFNINARFEMREMNCLILKRTDTIDRIKSRSAKAFVKYSDDRSLMQVRKRTISDFLAFLDGGQFPILIDETNYKENIDIDIKANKNYDLSDLNQQLLGYGLQLLPEKRKFKVIVITKNGAEEQ